MSYLDKIDPKALPQHVGIIMDGNGRWAAERHMPRIHGHRSAVKAVRASVETAAELGLNVLTLFAFSTENWQRPKKEVSALMKLFYEQWIRNGRDRVEALRQAKLAMLKGKYRHPRQWAAFVFVGDR